MEQERAFARPSDFVLDFFGRAERSHPNTDRLCEILMRETYTPRSFREKTRFLQRFLDTLKDEGARFMRCQTHFGVALYAEEPDQCHFRILYLEMSRCEHKVKRTEENLRQDLIPATNLSEGLLPLLLAKAVREDLFYTCLSTRLDLVIQGLIVAKPERGRIQKKLSDSRKLSKIKWSLCPLKKLR